MLRTLDFPWRQGEVNRGAGCELISAVECSVQGAGGPDQMGVRPRPEALSRGLAADRLPLTQVEVPDRQHSLLDSWMRERRRAIRRRGLSSPSTFPRLCCTGKTEEKAESGDKEDEPYLCRRRLRPSFPPLDFLEMQRKVKKSWCDFPGWDARRIGVPCRTRKITSSP